MGMVVGIIMAMLVGEGSVCVSVYLFFLGIYNRVENIVMELVVV